MLCHVVRVTDNNVIKEKCWMKKPIVKHKMFGLIMTRTIYYVGFSAPVESAPNQVEKWKIVLPNDNQSGIFIHYTLILSHYSNNILRYNSKFKIYEFKHLKFIYYVLNITDSYLLFIIN